MTFWSDPTGIRFRPCTCGASHSLRTWRLPRVAIYLIMGLIIQLRRWWEMGRIPALGGLTVGVIRFPLIAEGRASIPPSLYVPTAGTPERAHPGRQ